MSEKHTSVRTDVDDDILRPNLESRGIVFSIQDDPSDEPPCRPVDLVEPNSLHFERTRAGTHAPHQKR